MTERTPSKRTANLVNRFSGPILKQRRQLQIFEVCSQTERQSCVEASLPEGLSDLAHREGRGIPGLLVGAERVLISTAKITAG